MDELHKRVTDAIRPLLADEVYQSARIADAVIAELGLGPAVERFGAQESDGTVYGWEPDVETVRREWPGMPVMRCRYYLTPWERIEEDG